MTTILKSINHLHTILANIQTPGFFTFSLWNGNVVVSAHLQEGVHAYYSVAIVVERVSSPHEAKAKSFYFPDFDARIRPEKLAYAVEWIWDELTRIATPHTGEFFNQEPCEIKMHLH